MLRALKLDIPRDRKIVSLSGPIVGGMLSQTAVNLVDTAMVGRLGAEHLAAVGLGSVATWLSVSVLLGVGSATQALVARRVGEQRPEEAGRVLDNALLLGGSAALVVGLAIYLLTGPIFDFLAGDEAVARIGAGYLGARTLGFPFVVLNFAFRGFFHGIGDTRTYLKAIGLTNLLNVILDALLIYGLLGFPRLESLGAGLATALALAGGTLYYALWATPRTGIRRTHGAMTGRGLSLRSCRSILAILLPSGLQNLATALGFMAFYWQMARIDTVAVAVNSVLMNVSSVFHLPAYGMGLAAATLVGQSLGAGKPDEAEAWGWETVRLSTYALTLLGLTLIAIPDLIFRVFTDDPQVISAGGWAMRFVGMAQFATAILMVLSNVLTSAGNARFVMLANVLVTYLVMLPLVQLWAVHLGGGVAVGWALQGLARLAIGVILMLRFRAGGWKASRI